MVTVSYYIETVGYYINFTEAAGETFINNINFTQFDILVKSHG